MNLTTAKRQKLARVARVRSQLHAHSDRPRLAIHISLRHISAQIIDDSKQHTLAAVTTVGQKAVASQTMMEKAVWVGTQIAKAAKNAKVSKVVYDRGGKAYHGRIKALADAARAEGLEF